MFVLEIKIISQKNGLLLITFFCRCFRFGEEYQASMLLNKRSEGNETGRCGLFAENTNISLLRWNVSILGNIFRSRKLREQILQLTTWAEIWFSCGQSNQVKRGPQDYCNELIIWILNPLVVPIIRLMGLILKKSI